MSRAGSTTSRTGSVIEAVRASIALPGLFTPIMRDGALLMDGGLVNPVPVSLCRAMGADIVIAAGLNSNLVGHRVRKRPEPEASAKSGNGPDTMLGRLRADIGAWRSGL